MRLIQHFIDGAATTATPTRLGDVYDPALGKVQAQVALGDMTLLDEAVANAKAAQPAWAATNPQRRARVMFKFKELIEAHMDELAALLSPSMAR
jgi:malonate-semialdehyde dehydrogenase (acetylating)/methylmalonate-semialdehyde dehydrogenase